jgi:thiol-disulfide isomerase/thioredoxin
MIRKILLPVCLLLLSAGAGAQNIASVKMADVVKRFSKKSDTIYVVNFWATFCKPCIEEIPYFIKVTDKYKDKKVKLLLVSLDLPAFYPSKIAAFAKKNNYTPEIVWLKETNADIFCPQIDPQWSGAIPATIIVNSKTGKKIFFEEEMKEEKFEEAVKMAIGN